MESTSTAAPTPRKRSRPLRTVQTIIGIAVLLATLFTALPSRGLATGDFYDRKMKPETYTAELCDEVFFLQGYNGSTSDFTIHNR